MIFGIEIYDLLMYFMIYSFLGWCLEVVYHAVSKGIVVNRGFLNGPVCPIYGVTMICIFAMVHFIGTSESGHLSDDMTSVNAFYIFLGGMVLSTLMELVGGFLLDKLFHARWWDYSNKPFNFHGYICPEFSILWGLAILMVVRILQPQVATMTHAGLPHKPGWIIMGIFYALLLADFIVSVSIMAGLNKKIAELDNVRKEMRRFSDGLTEKLAEGGIYTAQHVDEARIQGALAEAEIKEDLEERAEKHENEAFQRYLELEKRQQELHDYLVEKANHHKVAGIGRLLRAFPDMEHHNYPEIFTALKGHVNKTDVKGTEQQAERTLIVARDEDGTSRNANDNNNNENGQTDENIENIKTDENSENSERGGQSEPGGQEVRKGRDD